MSDLILKSYETPVSPPAFDTITLAFQSVFFGFDEPIIRPGEVTYTFDVGGLSVGESLQKQGTARDPDANDYLGVFTIRYGDEEKQVTPFETFDEDGVWDEDIPGFHIHVVIGKKYITAGNPVDDMYQTISATVTRTA